MTKAEIQKENENDIQKEYNIENKTKGKKKPRENHKREEIEEAAEYASQLTGVRKGFLMGMLKVESNWGKNTGQCTFQQVEEGARQAYQNGRLNLKSWNLFNIRKNKIEEIADNLGYESEDLKVSCNPSRYNGTGGAIGIPQFMPDTWEKYEARLAEILEKENPDPWDTTDGVVAMALKLSDVPGVKEHNPMAEKNAAKLYLSGSTSGKYNWYANQVSYWANNYQSSIA